MKRRPLFASARRRARNAPHAPRTPPPDPEFAPLPPRPTPARTTPHTPSPYRTTYEPTRHTWEATEAATLARLADAGGDLHAHQTVHTRPAH